MADQLESTIQELIDYLNSCEGLPPVVAVVSALLLDERAYKSPKLQPTTAMRNFVNKITLEAASMRSLAETDERFQRRYSAGKFHIAAFGLPLEASVTDTESHEYQICISYAYEDRAIARKLARYLRDECGLSVFFDEFEQHKLVGEDLIDKLYDIYARRALLCVVLFSKIYLTKDWPRYELKAARSRALHSRGQGYILPIALEAEAVPEELRTIGYWFLKRGEENKVGDLIHERVSSLLLSSGKWIAEDEAVEWFRGEVWATDILDGFQQGIRQAGKGSRADFLRLLGMIAAVEGSVVPSVSALLEYVITSVPAVVKAFRGKDSVKVFGENASVHRMLGPDGPLLFSLDGWSEYLSTRQKLRDRAEPGDPDEPDAEDQ